MDAVSCIISCCGFYSGHLFWVYYFKTKSSRNNLVNENALQVPLKVFSEDGVLIGEFGEQKRRTIEYQDIP